MFTVCKYTLYTELFCHCLRQSFSSILLKKKSLTLRKKCQKFWCGDTVKDQKQSRNSLLGRMQWKTKCVQKKMAAAECTQKLWSLKACPRSCTRSSPSETLHVHSPANFKHLGGLTFSIRMTFTILSLQYQGREKYVPKLCQ